MQLKDMTPDNQTASSGSLDRRACIIETAATFFAAEGPKAVSMTSIAEAVGIRKASLYYFFDSKEEILREVLRPVVELPYCELKAIAEGPGDVVDKVTDGMVALGRAFEIYPSRMQILVRSRLDQYLSAEAYDEIRTLKVAYTALWREIIRAGVREGILRPVDDKIVAFCIIGSLNWMYAWFDQTGPLSGEDIGRLYASVFLRGLTADSYGSTGSSLPRRYPLPGADQPSVPPNHIT